MSLRSGVHLQEARVELHAWCHCKACMLASQLEGQLRPRIDAAATMGWKQDLACPRLETQYGHMCMLLLLPIVCKSVSLYNKCVDY